MQVYNYSVLGKADRLDFEHTVVRAVDLVYNNC